MSQYRLLFVVSLFFEFGGMQRTLLRIAKECVRRGHHVEVLTGGWIGQQPEDIKVHVVNTRASTNVRSNDKLAAQLAHHKQNNAYDCVIGFTKIAGVDVYYAGDPCYAARVEQDKSFWYKWFPRYRGFVRQEQAVFAPGQDTEIMLIAHQERDKFIHYYYTEVERFHLLPPGINRQRLVAQVPDAQQRQALRQQLGIAVGDLMLLTVGSRFKTKGLDRSLYALRALPPALRQVTKLVVVGDDKQGPYRRLAQRLGVAPQLVFAGAQQDIAPYYYAADLLIHPPYSENTGTILIEAMICGLPVLVTANCGFAYHVRDADAGLLCPEPFEQPTLNRLLQDMLLSERRDAWRQNGPEYCANTDLYSLIEKAADIIVARAARKPQAR